MLNLTSATTLIPYLFVAAYGLMIAQRGETSEVRPEERRRDLILSVLAVAYTLFMIYAGGLKFILLSGHPVRAGHGAVLHRAARAGQARLRQALGLGRVSASSSPRPSTASTASPPVPSQSRRHTSESNMANASEVKFGVHSEVGQLRK